jgi:hypothetical protein
MHTSYIDKTSLNQHIDIYHMVHTQCMSVTLTQHIWTNQIYITYHMIHTQWYIEVKSDQSYADIKSLIGSYIHITHTKVLSYWHKIREIYAPKICDEILFLIDCKKSTDMMILSLIWSLMFLTELSFVSKLRIFHFKRNWQFNFNLLQIIYSWKC